MTKKPDFKLVQFQSHLDVDKSEIIAAIQSAGVKEVYCVLVENGEPFMISTSEDARDLAFASKVFDNMANEAINESVEDAME